MFRIHDAPKASISAADFQRMMLKKAKAQALARAVQTARQRQAAEEQQQQLAEQNPEDAQPTAQNSGNGGREPEAASPQPMAVDGSPQPAAAAAEGRQDDGGAASAGRQSADMAVDMAVAEQAAEDIAIANAAKQEKEQHAAVLRRQLVQSRKETLLQLRRQEHEEQEADKRR